MLGTLLHRCLLFPTRLLWWSLVLVLNRFAGFTRLNRSPGVLFNRLSSALFRLLQEFLLLAFLLELNRRLLL